ncbi:MAG: metallophosphoesterase [Nanoarchaeota archaeon]
MKLLAFADLHESVGARRKIEAAIKKEAPDYVLCAGDFTVFEQHIDQMMDWLQKLAVPVLLIHGNHEEEAVVAKMCSHRGNITFIHKRPQLIDGVLVVGWGGGGFDEVDRHFDHYVKEVAPRIKKAERVVLVTHGPPYGTKLDHLHRDYVGNKSYTNFIKHNHNVVLALSGHIHENAEKEDKLNKARLVNPGPNGKLIVL